jgi:hypothetical protein
MANGSANHHAVTFPGGPLVVANVSGIVFAFHTASIAPSKPKCIIHSQRTLQGDAAHRSSVPLYLAHRSANMCLLFASYHQAPERLSRT